MPRASAEMVTLSAGSGLWNRLRNDDISRYVSVGKAEVGGGLRHYAECRRAGMSCFGTGCRTLGAMLDIRGAGTRFSVRRIDPDHPKMGEIGSWSAGSPLALPASSITLLVP